MIPVTTFAERRVAVFGLGRSGNATALALAAGGADVAAWDDTPAAREAAVTAGVSVVDLTTADWSTFSALVLAPGVPLTHPKPHWTVQKARAAGIEVIGDIELFFRERAAHAPGALVVAITGTNGKSTTTALVSHVLAGAGRDVQMGGNIGVAVLDLAPFAAGRVHVLELSSFQIDLTPSLAPSVGLLLNITPDHLDRHGPADDLPAAMRSYAGLKQRLVVAADTAIVGIDDALCSAMFDRLNSGAKRVLSISAAGPADVAFAGGRLLHGGATIADLAGIATLRGAHNGQNAAAAMAVALALGVAPATAAATFASFPGLAHRMEEVGRLAKAQPSPGGHVLFINDSKATNADSTDKALASFAGDIFWILGGKAKEGGIESLAQFFPRIARAYLIGASTPMFSATLAGKVDTVEAGTLDAALALATRDALASAAAEPVVLLSPACASYDQFKSFEHRGDAFRAGVAAIPGILRPGSPGPGTGGAP